MSIKDGVLEGAVVNGIRAGLNKSQTLQWGGVWDAVGNFLLTYSPSTGADLSSNVPATSCPVVIGGTINRLAFGHAGDLSSNNATIKVFVNTVLKKTLTATGGAGTVDSFSSMSIPVVAGDYVEVEYDAGATAPGASIVIAVVE